MFQVYGKLLFIIHVQVRQLTIGPKRRGHLLNPREGRHTGLTRITNRKSMWKIQVKAPKYVYVCQTNLVYILSHRCVYNCDHSFIHCFFRSLNI